MQVDEEQEYEFGETEEKTFATLMDSMRGAGMATSLLCLAHCLACIAQLFAANPSGLCAPSCSRYRAPQSALSFIMKVITFIMKYL